ncbi:unnamed protein product [Cercopithifilaria johnstoni]|uniref:Uncharacterized protein n=1 Tax=Cercopithifilaria johnstoni TaxID=2874296 RepID=A0A8J2QA58_9BILA|nr:unnamed protein product [Cercopithifilaria johnstoni]
MMGPAECDKAYQSSPTICSDVVTYYVRLKTAEQVRGRAWAIIDWVLVTRGFLCIAMTAIDLLHFCPTAYLERTRVWYSTIYPINNCSPEGCRGIHIHIHRRNCIDVLYTLEEFGISMNFEERKGQGFAKDNRDVYIFWPREDAT